MNSRWFAPLFLGVCCLLLFVLWLPGVRYPVISDTFTYVELGRGFWQHGTYMLNGAPYPRHLPLYPILAYPLTIPFGKHLGMHVAGLLSGFAVLLATFMMSKRAGKTSAVIAALVTLAVLIHPAFVLMSMLGSADLLFAALFLFSIAFYLRGEKDPRWYLAAGAAAGLACLTRYNGVPLFVLFGGFTLWQRPKHLRSSWFWTGMALGAAIFSVWLVRNWITFGNPLYTDYGAVLQQEAPNPLVTFLKNLRYYGNPVHNVFPFFFVFALIGLWKHARREPFLILAMLAAWLLSAVWYVQAIRFFFPGFVILLYFSALGIVDVVRHFRRAWPVMALLLICGIAIQSLSLCLYTYGACNAWFDRTVGIIPADMHLSSEGLYTWDLARQYINQHAESGAIVRYEAAEADGVFRSDLQATTDPKKCPAYRIAQIIEPTMTTVFRTADAPVTYVVKEECAK